MKTTAIDDILEAYDKLNLFDLKKYIDNERGLLKHKEKQQIIDAYKEGLNCIDNSNSEKTLSEKYYTSTFETNKETLK